MRCLGAVMFLVVAVVPLAALGQPAASPDPDLIGRLARLESRLEDAQHANDILLKAVDDGLWFDRVGDVALIDKVRLWGPPRWKEDNPTAIGAGQPLKFWAYVFLPRDLDRSRKAPLLILPHGGVHADFTTYHAHIVREMIAQGYVVIAPDYRGSTGYGRGVYEAIDYGGREIDDAHACRAYMLENYDFIDGRRVGMIGWSHGGLISLMTVCTHPDDYACCFAGVPVSDLVSRLGYLGADYAADFSAPFHIGQTVAENIAEYRRRSPVWHADELRTPLLVHGNKGDEDVNVLEVELLVNALKAAGKTFEYEIYDVPGGHSFDRLDTQQAQEIRLKIYHFLARYLKPPRVFGNVEELHAAGYR
jgi:dipeptidyl aminopeptidase/acylaminoacyl peptidase